MSQQNVELAARFYERADRAGPLPATRRTFGGAMLVRPDGSITWSHLSEDASDNATPAETLAAIRRI
jgi:hypothetical protein